MDARFCLGSRGRLGNGRIDGLVGYRFVRVGGGRVVSPVDARALGKGAGGWVGRWLGGWEDGFQEGIY